MGQLARLPDLVLGFLRCLYRRPSSLLLLSFQGKELLEGRLVLAIVLRLRQKIFREAVVIRIALIGERSKPRLSEAQ